MINIKYIVSALGTEALPAIEIEAKSIEEAKQKYQDLWEEGMIEALDYEFDHFTITEENGKDIEVK